MKCRNLLVLGTILLTSCSQPQQPTFCPIVVHADNCTKEWLHEQKPPECVNEYFHKIGIQQADIDKYCK